MSITFDLYLKKVMLLADTMVVKHDYLARLINNAVLRNTANRMTVDESRPETWKYYMNLAGEYHQYDKDTLLKYSDGAHQYMRIKVAGDFGPIEVDFTYDLINGPDADPAIANEYKYGTGRYKELVARYPDLEELVLGIVNPIPKDISINARNGEVLLCGEYQKSVTPHDPKKYYYKRAETSIFTQVELIEVQEDDLIQSLQHYCDTFLSRWLIRDYVRVDDLYFHTLWGVMFSGMPMAIINARLAACKSNRAHTYHVRELLNSHGYLGRHIDSLAIKESLWLYRNVEYLDANMGTQKTFDQLIEHIFTASNIPLKGYLLAHDAKDIPLGRMPKILGYEQPLNFDAAGSILTRALSVEDLFDKERPLARDNEVVEAEDIAYVEFEGARTQGSIYDTKLLESVVIDYSNYLPYRIQDVLMNLWAFAIARGTYRGTVFVTNPRSGERIHLTMLNAFILMVYCFNKGHSGLTLPKVPKVHVSMIPREDFSPIAPFKPRFNREYMRDLAPVDQLTDRELDIILANSTFRSNYSSSIDFYNEVRKVWSRLCDDYDYADDCQLIAKGCYRHIVARRKYWWDMELPLVHSGMSYTQWFALNDLDIEDLSSDDLLKLATSLHMYATGYVENDQRKIKAIQQSCIDILKHYSSHTIHVSANNAAYAPLMSRNSGLRIDNLQYISNVHVPVHDYAVSQKTKTASSIKVKLPHTDTLSQEHVIVNIRVKLPIDVGVDVVHTGSLTTGLTLDIGDSPMHVDRIYDL